MCVALVLASVSLVSVAPRASGQTPATFSDAFSGFAVTAPRGWRLLRDGEMQLPKGARAGFVDARGEVVVYVLVELVPGGVIKQDDRALERYVDTVISKPGAPGVYSRPTPCRVAGRSALRTTMTFAAGGGEIFNTATYTREGYLYFLVGSLAMVHHRQRAATAHTTFERAVTISRTSDDVLAELAAPIVAIVPYLDAEGVRLLMRACFDRMKSFDTTEARTLGFAIVSLGLELLPAADLAASDVLHAKALATLSEEERAFLVRTNAEIVAGRPVSDDDQEKAFRTFRRAYSALTEAEVATLARLARDYIRLGIVAYDARR